MTALNDDNHRAELINRLKRAEGQLRGVQRMIEEAQPCRDILSQLSAVRKALDSACVRMTACYMGQELTARTKYRALIKKRLFPVRIEGALPDPGTSWVATGGDGASAAHLANVRLLAEHREALAHLFERYDENRKALALR